MVGNSGTTRKRPHKRATSGRPVVGGLAAFNILEIELFFMETSFKVEESSMVFGIRCIGSELLTTSSGSSFDKACATEAAMAITFDRCRPSQQCRWRGH
jgi:hypothetical protein